MQRDLLFVSEMIDAAEQARDIGARSTVATLEQDRVLRDALLWNFTVLGEAARAVSDELKSRHPDVDWRRPADTRNRIVHGYWSIDLEILHTTAVELLPDMITALKTVLDDVRTNPAE